ncbi:MAG: DUF4139 domain-containing protein [Bacteroidota bacterium]
MKHTSIIMAFIMISLVAFATEETKIQSRPEHITVYTSGAEISRSADFAIHKGQQTIVFDSLSPHIKANSIQVNGNGDFVILDVKFRTQQPDPLKSNKSIPPRIKKEIELLKDSIRLKGYLIRDYDNQMQVLESEKNILLNNALVRGNGGDTIPELKQTLAFFREKLNNIHQEVLQLEKESYPHNEEFQRMNNRLDELKQWDQRNNNTTGEAVPQIVISILSNSNGNGSIDISYLVNKAGWHATYDIRATDEEEISLIYKAGVYQNTGKSWKDVSLNLSTLNPNQQFSKPELPVLHAYYQQQNQYPTHSSQRTEQDATVQVHSDPEMTQAQEPAGSAYQHTSAVSSLLNVEYQVELDFEIPSDGKNHTIPIQNKKLGAEFNYYAVPRMSDKTFLMAKITDWHDLDLLQGEANLYFNGRYTGQTTITPQITQDTMEITLGKANGIVVSREKETQEEKPQLVGSWVTESFTYHIKLRNNTGRMASISVEDAIPHSTNDEIRIKLKESDGADFNEDNSHLSWDIDLPAGQEKTVQYTFTVKYDKNKPVNLNL